MQQVDPRSIPRQTFDGGIIKWFVTPNQTKGAGITFGEPEKVLESLPDFKEVPIGSVPKIIRPNKL
ncbi:MAG: hypothetical protein NVS4B11_18840 [Ktedonobacteraceae bacterium]